MLVTCPECATRYEVDDAAFSAGGRAVRCNHCGCEWYQIGPAKPAQTAAPADVGGGADAPPLEPAKEQRGVGAFAPLGARAEAPGADFDVFRKKPGERRGRGLGAGRSPDLDPVPPVGEEPFRRAPDELARRAPRGGRRPVGARGAASGHDLGPRLDAGAQLPMVVESDDEDMRRVARRGVPARLSGRVGAVIGVAVVAAAAVFGAQFLEPDGPDAPDVGASGEGGVAALSADGGLATIATDNVPALPASSGGSVGIGAASPGVVIVERKYDLRDLPEGPALLIWGVVANNGPDDVPGPIIEVVSRDAGGAELQRFRASAEVDVLGVGDSARFQARMMYPLSPVHFVDFYIVNQ